MYNIFSFILLIYLVLILYKIFFNSLKNILNKYKINNKIIYKDFPKKKSYNIEAETISFEEIKEIKEKKEKI